MGLTAVWRQGSGRIEIVLLKVKRLEAEIAFYAAISNNLL